MVSSQTIEIRPGRIPAMDNRVMRLQVLQKQGKGNNSAEKNSKTDKQKCRYKRQLLSTFLNSGGKLDIVKNI